MNTMEELTDIENCLLLATKGTELESRIYLADESAVYAYFDRPMPTLHLTVDAPNGAIRLGERLQEQGLTLGAPTNHWYNGACLFQLNGYEKIEIHAEQSRKALPCLDSDRVEDLYVPIALDSLRRPYTVSALYRRLCDQELIDPTSKGIADLRIKTLRALDADLLFDIEPERILQGIALAVSLDFEIEPGTLEKMTTYTSRLKRRSLLRMRDWFSEILVSPDPVRGLTLLKELGILEIIIPEMSLAYTMSQNKYHFGTVWEHTLRVVELVPPSLTLRLAALLHDIGKVMCREVTEDGKVHFLQHESKGIAIIMSRLLTMRYDRKMAERIALLSRLHMRTKGWGKDAERMKESSLRELQLATGDPDCFEELMELIDADNKAHADDYCMPDQVERIREKSSLFRSEGRDMFHFQLPFSEEFLKSRLFPYGQVPGCVAYLKEKACKQPVRSEKEWLYLVDEFTKRLSQQKLAIIEEE